MPSQVTEQWLDAVLKLGSIDVMSLPATERGEGKEKMARAESNMSKQGMEEEYPGVGKF